MGQDARVKWQTSTVPPLTNITWMFMTLWIKWRKKFPLKIFQMCYAEFAAYIDGQFPHLSQTQRAWIYVYTAQGSSGILNYWINDGMAESPKEVASFIEQLISNTLKSSVS